MQMQHCMQSAPMLHNYDHLPTRLQDRLKRQCCSVVVVCVLSPPNDLPPAGQAHAHPLAQPCCAQPSVTMAIDMWID